MTSKQLGIVRRFNVERGYGFIRNAEIDYQGNVVPIGPGRLYPSVPHRSARRVKCASDAAISQANNTHRWREATSLGG